MIPQAESLQLVDEVKEGDSLWNKIATVLAGGLVVFLGMWAWIS